MKNIKKLIGAALAATLIAGALASCGETSISSGDAATTAAAENNAKITVCSREDGSGTRGAFIELLGIEEKGADGKKVDNTTDDAEITNSTSVMISTVEGNKNAIGYISLGSLKDNVKALKVDGVEATAENVKNGSYKVSRPFNIATKDNLSDLGKDFIAFILSTEGQKIVTDNGYISVGTPTAYSGTKPAGKLTIAGSSSVTPVMEKLKEAYLAVNTSATIEVQQSDSSNGMKSAIEGTCDIGMASRELKDSETSKGLTATVIAQDGIAVIVNKENSVDALTSEQIKNIYVGNATTWADAAK